MKGYMRYNTLPLRLTVISAVLNSIAIQGATFTVANGDLAGFKAAIQAANATAEADTVSLAYNGDYSFSTYHPTANPLDRTALPTITSAITIEANGSVIRRADSIVSPVPQFRLIRISADGALTLRHATVRNGDLGEVNGDFADAQGSGLRNDGGTLVIEHCRFDKNHSLHWASAVHTTGPTVVTDSKFIENTSSDGGTGAIRAANTSTVTIERSQFTKNTGDETIRITSVDDVVISQCSVVQAGSGTVNFGRGIVVGDSVLRMANCTITGGSSQGLVIGGPTATVTHCTITEHGQVNRPGVGIYLGGGSLSLRNSILAFNNNGLPGSADCKIAGGTLVQNTRNLISDGSCSPDFTGDPKLGSLGNYGGTTKVFPLIFGSQAIDNGDDLYSEPIDQRGVARPIDAHSDIGAYEGSVFDFRRFVVDLIYRSEPYIIICDPLGEEVIDLAVAGAQAVTARSINPASLSLGNARAGSARAIGIRDVNRDGIDDLVVQFRLADVYRGVSSCENVTLLEMQGQTREGQPIVGYVNVVAAAGR